MQKGRMCQRAGPAAEAARLAAAEARPAGMLELIMQAFCRPPYSTVKWPASRQTRFLHLGFRGEAARVTTCKHGEAACYRDRRANAVCRVLPAGPAAAEARPRVTIASRVAGLAAAARWTAAAAAGLAAAGLAAAGLAVN